MQKFSKGWGANLGYLKQRGRSCKQCQEEHWNYCLVIGRGGKIDTSGSEQD